MRQLGTVLPFGRNVTGRCYRPNARPTSTNVAWGLMQVRTSKRIKSRKDSRYKPTSIGFTIVKPASGAFYLDDHLKNKQKHTKFKMMLIVLTTRI